jgi:beta-1,4-mannosyl-glycoprotein beta-1,4-N-acetylglucosaminyltransferase
VFPFYNELDLLELRLRTLNEAVDYFVISECDETFSGQKKPMHYAENRGRYEEFSAKIIYNPIGSNELADMSNEPWVAYKTQADHVRQHKHGGRAPQSLHSSLKREITHRDAAVRGLLPYVSNKDLILLSDVDEIPKVSAIESMQASANIELTYFEMDWFLYYLNNKVELPWYGTAAFKLDHLRGQSLDLLRYASSDPKGVPGSVLKDGGWHFSYLGGSGAVKEKMAAMPYQGMRGELAKIFSSINPAYWRNKIRKNEDILLSNRPMKRVLLDKSFPKKLFEMPDLIEKYRTPDGDIGRALK